MRDSEVNYEATDLLEYSDPDLNRKSRDVNLPEYHLRDVSVLTETKECNEQ
jgi:hypothetical protein